MSATVELGPLVVATERLAAVLLIAAFLVLAGWLSRRSEAPVERAATAAAIAGIVFARASFVTTYWPAYREEPWTILALWQGGFSLQAGVFAAILVLLLLIGPKSRATAVLIGALLASSAVYVGIERWSAADVRPLPPQITMLDLKGQPRSTGSLRGEPVVLNLWASWCGPCRREMPMLVEEAKRSGIPILLVNQGESEAVVRSFLQQQGLLSGNVLMDPATRLGQVTGSGALPTTLFVDGAGRIQNVHVGEISRAGLQSQIRSLTK